VETDTFCANDCNNDPNCRAFASYFKDKKKMCQLMNIPFKEIPRNEKNKLVYEPGSRIYDHRPFPPKEKYQYVMTNKDSLGMLISFIDFLTIFSLMIFIRCLRKS